LIEVFLIFIQLLSMAHSFVDALNYVVFFSATNRPLSLPTMESAGGQDFFCKLRQK